MQKTTRQLTKVSKKRMALQSRRNAVFGLATFSVCGPFLAGCQSQPSLQCASKGQLRLSEDLARKGRQYVEISSRDTENCANCSLFRSGNLAQPACGVCGVDGLPAHPQGYCISWAPVNA